MWGAVTSSFLPGCFCVVLNGFPIWVRQRLRAETEKFTYRHLEHVNISGCHVLPTTLDGQIKLSRRKREGGSRRPGSPYLCRLFCQKGGEGEERYTDCKHSWGPGGVVFVVVFVCCCFVFLDFTYNLVAEPTVLSQDVVGRRITGQRVTEKTVGDDESFLRVTHR